MASISMVLHRHLHAAVFSRCRTFIRLHIGRVFTEGRDTIFFASYALTYP